MVGELGQRHNVMQGRRPPKTDCVGLDRVKHEQRYEGASLPRLTAQEYAGNPTQWTQPQPHH